MYCWNKVPVMMLNLLMRTFVFIALTIVLLSPLRSYADPVAQIIGAPTGLTNQTNPIISISGNGVVSYKYELDGGDYSDEIPVNTPISFSADVNIFGLNFIAGNTDLQEFLDYRDDFIDSVTFSNVDVDTPIVFLLNPIRMTLQSENILYVEGKNIDQLDVHMNNSQTVRSVIVNSGPGYNTYTLKTDTPQTDFIRIINNSASTASFKINLNNMLFASDGDVLSEIQAMLPEYANEPIERKVWRFIRDNRYHWYPLSYFGWITASPALFFNSIGFGFCDDSAALFCQLMTFLGYQTRIWGLGGHVVPEVLINGKWEMYDPDLKVYYRNYQGQVAGVEELAANPDLITNPISPLSGTASNAYSQSVANIYSSTDDNGVYLWNYGDTIPNYLLNIQIPSGGIFEFPAVFAAPIRTLYNKVAPFYTNARLIVPRRWAGTLNTPLVIHSIGYDGPHTLSVIGKDSVGNWQTTPTVATWTTDSWAPITTPYQRYPTDPVTLTVNEPATIYYTLDGSTPTTSSAVYNGPVSISPNTVLKFFAIDLAGNRERVKCYNAPPVSSVSLSADKSSPQLQGAIITFTAAATGLSGTYEYIFWLRNPNGQWTAPQGYSGTPIWQWNTTGENPGTYSLQVWARNIGSTAAYEAWKGIAYTINAPPVGSVSLTTDKSSPQVQGAVITFTAAASGGSGTYEYIFWLWNPNTGQWSLGQAYSSNPSWTWNTAGIGSGTYWIQVWARSAGSTAAYEAWREMSYTISLP